jgi:hypothetical protein
MSSLKPLVLFLMGALLLCSVPSIREVEEENVMSIVIV